MPSFSSVALFSLTVLGAAAAPTPGRWGGHNGQCLNDDQAQQIADVWDSLIQNYSDELADSALTTDFTDYSESVNTLINSCPQGDAAQPLPLLAPTFTSREQFKLGQGQQPPINFELLNLWHSCSTVNLRWKTTNTANITDVKPVVGIIALEVFKNDNGGQYPWLIQTVYSEFDSGAWLQNLVEAGICKTDAGIPSGNGGSGSGSGTGASTAVASSTADATAPSSTWVASSASDWAAATTTSCSEEWAASSTTAWATPTSTWA
ncbi:hypothetical protein Q7P37_007836 [Cladosporium fusiforme]